MRIIAFVYNIVTEAPYTRQKENVLQLWFVCSTIINNNFYWMHLYYTILYCQILWVCLDQITKLSVF